MKNCSKCGSVLDENWFCEKCDANKCDVCGRVSHKVRAGRWLFHCIDNSVCKDAELSKVYDNELAPSLADGSMPDAEVLEQFI